MSHVVPNDERASVGSDQAQQLKAQENSPVEGYEHSVPSDSRRMWNNGPSGIRRPAQAQGLTRQAVSLGNRVCVSFPYDAELVESVKALSGRKWDPDNKRWICEPSADLAHLLAANDFAVDQDVTVLLQGAIPQNTFVQDCSVLILKPSYNPALLEALRSVPKRKWDKDRKEWRFSISEINKLQKISADFGIAWDIGQIVDDTPQVIVQDGWLSVAFNADRDVADTMSELYGVRWNGSQMRWLINLAQAAEVSLIVEKFGLSTNETVEKVFVDAASEIEMLKLSKAQNADLEVHGMSIDLMPFQRAGILYALKAIGATPIGNESWQRRTPTLQEACD